MPIRSRLTGYVYFESDGEPQEGEFVSVRITESLGPDLLGVTTKGGIK